MVSDPKKKSNRLSRMSVRDRIAVSSTLVTVVGLIATLGAAVKWN